MPQNSNKMRVVIAGGGTAGWLTAAAISHQFGSALDITLVESNEIGTVGVGEATIPPMKTFHRLLRIDEREFMKATHATFKLGIQFENWKNGKDKYFHSFGFTGKDTLVTEFIHFWLRGREMGVASDFGDYCAEFKAAMCNKVSVAGSATKLNYAFHLDAGLYAAFLRKSSESRGVKRVEGKIADVLLNADTGYIESLQLECGKTIPGDLFIDCTGFKGLLIEQALHCGYEDWSHWLPCDRAIAVQTKSQGELLPYTRSIAHEAGWRWQIPLQHRTGNGIVYCSRYMSDDEAQQKLLNDVSGELLTEPKLIRFRTGRRRKNWMKNCVAVGLSSGFLEPLESTSIHLIMTAVTRLIQMFPQGSICSSVVDEYNNQAASEIEKIRDFIILHYKLTDRGDTPFWRYCKNMGVPGELIQRMRLFQQSGKSYQTEGELFRLDSWTQVMLGQGLYPETYHPIVDTMSAQELQGFLGGVFKQVDERVKSMPSHKDCIRDYCKV